jgi:hypothetical protein
MIDSMALASTALRMLDSWNCGDFEITDEFSEIERMAKSALAYFQGNPDPDAGSEVRVTSGEHGRSDLSGT